MGEGWRGTKIGGIRTILKARMKKERGKRVERTEGDFNDEDALRQEFGIDLEVDGSEAAAGLADPGRGQGWHRAQSNQGANQGVLNEIAVL